MILNPAQIEKRPSEEKDLLQMAARDLVVHLLRNPRLHAHHDLSGH